MDHSLVARISTDFLIGFSALFSLINPLGMAFVFAEKTRTLPDEVGANLARSVASYSLVLILAAMLLGAPILSFFGIGLPALRIAGGLLVALAGYGMLTAPEARDKRLLKKLDAVAGRVLSRAAEGKRKPRSPIGKP